MLHSAPTAHPSSPINSLATFERAVVASVPMTKGRLLLSSLLLLAPLGAAGCTSHGPAALGVDTPLVPYVAPDIDELTDGDDFALDPEEEAEEAEEAPAPAPAPASPTTKTPAQPAKPGK